MRAYFSKNSSYEKIVLLEIVDQQMYTRIGIELVVGSHSEESSIRIKRSEDELREKFPENTTPVNASFVQPCRVYHLHSHFTPQLGLCKLKAN
jgi:hypothetical protein